MTSKMRSGIKAQELVEKLELRRTLERYGFDRARRIFGAWLTSDELGLSGRVDRALIVDETGEAAVVGLQVDERRAGRQSPDAVARVRDDIGGG